MFNGLTQIGGIERPVDDQRNFVFLSDFGDRRNVKDVQARVGNKFRQNALGIGLNCRFNFIDVTWINRRGRDPIAGPWFGQSG